MVTPAGYTVKETIYSSDKCIIYRAIDSSDSKPVILKLLNKTYPTQEELARFRIEFEMCSRLTLDGVITVYDLKSHGNSVCIVMEDFGGESLRKLLNNSLKLSVEAFLDFAVKLAAIIGRVHSQHIMHKDINPNNVVWNRTKNIIKVIDFGISAQLSREQASLVSPEKLEGTLLYMSPEQTGRMNRSIDYRTDLYSLGALFYELLTGSVPFESSDAVELVHSHIAKQPTPLSVYNPALPQIISQIVLKLLSKNAEDRYQSAQGLKYDLERCRKELSIEGEIRLFELGKEDVSEKFTIHEKLYGREQEIISLLDTFERVAEGGSEMMLVTGYSGIGKSALIHEIHKPIVGRRGYFISGKFDQFQLDMPYFGITQAFRSLVHQLLSESDESLAQWRTHFLQALGANGRLITDVIPEMEQVIGVQPTMPDVNPTEAQNRFIITFRNFVKIIATAEHPLTLFLDDLQWCDQPSLALINNLMMVELPFFLLLGAYRPNEVKEGHPLLFTLENIEKTKLIKRISLENLNNESVQHLVADSLHQPFNQVSGLSEIVFKKTEGNPFFVREFLRNLYNEKLINFEHENSSWTWNEEQISNTSVSGNVVEFMIQRIRELSEECQKALQYAACIGNRFDLKTLAAVMKQESSETAHILWPAIETEIILPQSEKYRLLENTGADDLGVLYRFQHDRIQQAAYSMLNDVQKQQIHLEAGRFMLELHKGDVPENIVIEVVSHFNSAAKLVVKDEEVLKLAQLNLRAGQKAQRSAAYQPAFNYFETGIAALGTSGWTTHYDLRYALGLGYSQCAYLSKKYDEAEQQIEELLQKGKTNLEKVEVVAMRMRQYTTVGKPEEAIEQGCKALALLGVKISPNAGAGAVFSEIIKAKIQLRNKKIDELIDLPVLADPEQRMIARLLSEMGAPAYVTGKENLFGLLAIKVVNMSLKYGNTPESSYAYIAFGMLLSVAFGDFKSSYEFGKLAIALNEKLNDIEYRCRVIAAYCVLTHHWNHHWSDLTSWYQKGIEAGYQSGDLFYLGHNASNCVVWNPKIKLGEKVEEHRKYLAVVKGAGFEDAVDSSVMSLQIMLNYQGLTKNRFSLSDDTFDEEKTLAKMTASKYASGIAMYHFHKAEINLVYGDYKTALMHIKEADKDVKALVGLTYVSRFCYLSFFAYSQALAYKVISQSDAFKRMNAEYKKMKKWASHNPGNFLHIQLLMEAEMAAHKGKHAEVAHLYDKAIEEASINEWIQDTAFANELAAGYYLRSQLNRAANGYMQDAFYLYNRWGASAKVAQLAEKHADMLRLLEKRQSGISARTTVMSTSVSKSTSTSQSGAVGRSTGKDSTSSLDLISILKASQAISGVVVLDDLLEKLMRILIENAGAQKGVLLLDNQGSLFVQAEIAMKNTSEHIRVLQNTILRESENVPISMINYVVRTRTTSVVDNISEHNLFNTDTYFGRNSVKSALCIPLVKQDVLKGILYLENSLTYDAFTPRRQEVLDMLCSQITISVDNAILYENMEERISQRTAEVEKQKQEIENSHRLIVNSINYAKKIQHAVLPSNERMLSILPDHFVLFRPRDIVSGDFYWIEKLGKYTVVVAADCTGHGVPGAFMSMLGISLLNETVNRNNSRMPGQILNELREKIKTLLRQTGSYEEQKDGMDMAVCVLDTLEMTAFFAGAYNPMYVVRNCDKKLDAVNDDYTALEKDNRCLLEVKGDKQPVAIHMKEKSFSSHQIQLFDDDMIYLFSDGYIDQTGGDKGRKLMTQNFKHLLIDVSSLAISDQHDKLQNYLSNWQKGSEYPQVDDVLVIGIRVNKTDNE